MLTFREKPTGQYYAREGQIYKIYHIEATYPPNVKKDYPRGGKRDFQSEEDAWAWWNSLEHITRTKLQRKLDYLR